MSTITIEILYPEIANLFGDMMNMKYLMQCLPDAEFISTSLPDEPAFVSQPVSMIYLGPMTEGQQELVISALLPFRQRLEELIAGGTIFLCTGNALEIFGLYIENEDGSRIEALKLFQTYAKRDMLHRYNSLIMGEFKDIRIIGFKAQFSHSYGDNSREYFFKVLRGDGLSPGNSFEGLSRNHFFGTYTVGPLLLLNPLFTKYLFTLLGAECPVLAFEDTIMDAYRARLREFENEKLKY